MAGVERTVVVRSLGPERPFWPKTCRALRRSYESERCRSAARRECAGAAPTSVRCGRADAQRRICPSGSFLIFKLPATSSGWSPGVRPNRPMEVLRGSGR